MGLSLKNLGKKIYEFATPQNENAMRAAQSSIQGAQQRIQQTNGGYGVLAQPRARQQFIEQNQPQRFSIPSTVGTAVADTFTKPEVWASAPKVNIGKFKGSGVAEDFINSPFKIGEGAVQVGQGQFKQGVGNAVSGALEGPLGLIPVGKTAQVGLKAKALLPAVKTGAITGAKQGAVYGSAYGGANAASENASLSTIAKSAGLGGLAGAAGGAVLGGATPVATKIVKTRVPLDEVGSISKPKVSLKVPQTPVVRVAPRNNGGVKDQIGEALIDKDAVIINQLKDLEKQTGQKGVVDKFMFNSNMQRQSPGIASHEFRRAPEIQRAIGGLSKDDYKNFVDYASARRELANANEGLSTSRATDELQAVVNQHHGQFDPNYQALNSYYKTLAEKAAQSGVISPEQLASYTKDGDYIRLQRDMGDLNQRGGGGNAYSLNSTVTGQKRTGSQRAVLDPVHTALDYTEKIQKEIGKNTTASHLLPTLEKAGLAKEVTQAQAKNKNTLNFRDNGIVRYYEVSPEIKRVADQIAPFQLNALERVVGAPARVLRAGATALNPVFTASNILKDQLGSAVISSKARATHTPQNIAVGLKNSAQDFFGGEASPLYQEYIKRGGDRTQYDLTRNAKNTAQLVDRVRGGKKVGAKQSLLHPIRTLEDANAITEKATRFQNFKGIYEDAVKQGKPHEQALQDATMAALNHTVNFGRAGSWGRIVNLLIPYSNASVQGGRTLVNAAKARPFATTTKGFAWVGTPVAAATIWNTADPQRKEAYENIDEFEKQNNLILLKPGTTVGQVKNGSYDAIKIPLPPDIGSIFQPIRRGLEASQGVKDGGITAGNLITDTSKPFTGPVNISNKNALASSLIPQAAKPAIQQASNKDFYTGKQVVPDYLREAQTDPTQRVNKYTSSAARILGEATGIEPVRFDKFATDTGGKLGSFGINASDHLLNLTGASKKDEAGKAIIGGQDIGSAFSQRFSKASAVADPNNKGQQYYKKVTEATRGLNKNEQAAFDTITPSKVDGSKPDKTLYDASVRAGIFMKYPKVLEAASKINKGGDPFYDLPGQQQKVVMTLQTLSNDPGNATVKKLTKDNPWLNDYYSKTSDFYDKLSSDGKLKDNSGSSLPKPPTQTSALKSKLGQLDSLEDASQRAEFLANNSDVSDYFSAQTDYTRKKRELLGLPQFDKYPQPTGSLKQKLDLYNTLPKNDGPKGGNKTRGLYLKANPDITDYFSKTAQYNLQTDAQLAQFEGEDFTSKGIKSIKSLASALGEAGGASRGSAGKTDSSLNPYKYAVSLKAGGSIAKPVVKKLARVPLKGKIAIKSGGKPKVSTKKSRV